MLNVKANHKEAWNKMLVDDTKKKISKEEQMHVYMALLLKKKSHSCQSISGLLWISNILSLTIFCTQYFKWNKIWGKCTKCSLLTVQYVNVSDWLYSWTAWGNGSILIILYVNLVFVNNLYLPARCYSLSTRNVISVDTSPYFLKILPVS
jgi:hypothetical protein